MHAPDSAATGGTPLNWDLYRKAVVDIEFGERTVRVEPRPRGTVEGVFPVPDGDAVVHVITAWNPFGRTVPDDDNSLAHRRLLDEVRRLGLTWWPAVGGSVDGTHQEVSVAVVGLRDADALEVGRRFGQDAIFAWSSGAWRVLACGTDAADVRGWAATARPA